jgi:pimeloyl-ACP methyl ester carboxylesterase
LLYAFQEKLLFFPTKLSADYTFTFRHPFEEKNYQINGDVKLNTVLFKADSTKGIVLFLHGNGGAIHGWGDGAGVYLAIGYDVLYLDYRGYGKSTGRITSEAQLISDAQLVYDDLKKKYSESKLIISGTSIGTGIAVQLAAKNNPQQLVLVSPYASLKQLIGEKVPVVPRFIVRYKLASKEYLKDISCPISVLHGDEDLVIPHKHALQLKALDDRIDLTIIEGFGHNDLTISPNYKNKITTILAD